MLGNWASAYHRYTSRHDTESNKATARNKEKQQWVQDYKEEQEEDNDNQ